MALLSQMRRVLIFLLPMDVLVDLLKGTLILLDVLVALLSQMKRVLIYLLPMDVMVDLLKGYC